LRHFSEIGSPTHALDMVIDRVGKGRHNRQERRARSNSETKSFEAVRKLRRSCCKRDLCQQPEGMAKGGVGVSVT
jgi:hypothetical protein